MLAGMAGGDLEGIENSEGTDAFATGSLDIFSRPVRATHRAATPIPRLTSAKLLLPAEGTSHSSPQP